jgi:hypothetical protein
MLPLRIQIAILLIILAVGFGVMIPAAAQPRLLRRRELAENDSEPDARRN